MYAIPIGLTVHSHSLYAQQPSRTDDSTCYLSSAVGQLTCLPPGEQEPDLLAIRIFWNKGFDSLDDVSTIDVAIDADAGRA